MSGIGDFVDDYLEKSIQAWYGANETYGTQSDWLTGEGLTEAWGHDPNRGVYPQYSNDISELVGENPIFNALIDSERILSHDSGGMRGPGWLDWAELGISAVPVAGPAIARGAKIVNKGLDYLDVGGGDPLFWNILPPRAIEPASIEHVTKPIWQKIQDASKSKFDPNWDWRIDKGRHFEDGVEIPPTYVDSGYRNSLEGKIKEKLGLLPEKVNIPEKHNFTLQDLENQTSQWTDELSSLGTDILKKDQTVSDLEIALRHKGFDTSKTLDELSDIERPSIFQISADEWDTIEPRIKAEWLEREGLVEGDMTVFHYLNEGRDKLGNMASLAREYGDKELLDTVSEGIQRADDLMLNWPDTPFMQVLREGDGPTEKIAKNFRRIKRADKLTKEFSLEERMAMKPSHVDASEWKKLVEGLDDMGEVRNIARRMTLRLID
jgi:hypothetical protein